ncbi:MAG TPA: diacylglyceryl transferase [Mariniphaga anaerophila]|uniref:Diacylglyceryl transferase n=1 Tax=Mariniphaga anaerophila TaxID=1484053 RepID=A0A831LLN8_9BACT|nr:diacylglyceryl transferase [Mariniphaga anaerophila]
MLKKLKKKWNIKSNAQLVLILVIFSVTGSASLFVRKAVFNWIGITGDTSLWIKIPLYVLIIFPAYQILFLLIGALFGQFRFVWEFEKKFFSRLSFKK